MALAPKIRDCGQLIVAFANEKTVYKSVTAAIPIIKRVFDFRGDFIKRAYEANINIDYDKLKLSKSEERTLELLLENVDKFYYVQTLLVRLQLNLVGVDHRCRVLLFRDAPPHYNCVSRGQQIIQSIDTVADKIVEISRRFLAKETVAVARKGDGEVYKVRVGGLEEFFKSRFAEIGKRTETQAKVDEYFYKNLNEFALKADELLEAKGKLDALFADYPEIEKKLSVLNDYTILDMELNFRKFKIDLVKLIELIVAGKRLHGTKVCGRFLEAIETVLMPMPIMQPNDMLNYVPVGVSEEDFFNTDLSVGAYVDEYSKSMSSALPSYDLWCPYMNTITYCLSEIFQFHGYKDHFGKCNCCGNYYFATTKRKNRRYCSSSCKSKHHNQVRIESGEHRRYKRKKRAAGAKESYYG